MKLTQIQWWIQYLKYCKKFNINAANPTYEEYLKTMEKVENWVDKNGLLS